MTGRTISHCWTNSTLTLVTPFVRVGTGWYGVSSCNYPFSTQLQQPISLRSAAEILEICRTHRLRQILAWPVLGHTDELSSGNSYFGRELRAFNRLEPVDESPIAADEAREPFCALQVYGMRGGLFNNSVNRASGPEHRS